MKILFTGGGTGGHILPIVAIAREIKRFYPKKGRVSLNYIGPKDDFGMILLSQEGIKVKSIFAGKIRRYLSFKSVFLNLIDILLKTPIGMIQAFFYVFLSTPDLIFSKGGYGSISAVIAGKILQVPIFLHESDVVPGLANRIMDKFVLEIFVSFSSKKTGYFSTKKMLSVGNPIRREILEGSKKKAQELFGLTYEKPVILILGGSQGSERINDMILTILSELLFDFEIIHQTGEKNFKDVKAEAEIMVSKTTGKYYHPFPFLKETEIKQAYSACDLVISRAGSGGIFEIAALGKPSILIPLQEAAQDHQAENAYSYAEKGGAIVIEETNLTPHFFLEKLRYLFSHPDEIKHMQKAAIDFSRPKAAEIIAKYIIEYLTQ